MKKNLRDIRREYSLKHLNEKEVNPNPVIQFNIWMDEAINSVVNDPTAMVLSTADSNGKPSSRIVLLKKVDENGFVFYTNYNSRKGGQLEKNPLAALLFFWPELERQIRIEGKVERISEKESDEYFTSRPALSRISAIISPQSKVIPGRSYLENLLTEFKNSKKEITRPGNWGGYLLIPELVEFWQGRENRLHDRIQYSLNSGKWNIERLAP